MGVLYPDNLNRANRVTQLCSDIAQLQTRVKEAVADAKTQDERSVVILEKIAKQKGYKTLAEFIAAAEKQLSPEDKEKYEQMKKEFEKQAFEKKDSSIDIAMKVSSGLSAISLGVGVASGPVSLLFQRTFITVALRAIGIGLVRVIAGSVEEGVDLIKAAGNIFKFALKGEALAGKVATVFRVIKVAGEVLGALGFAFDLVLLIYEAVDGAKQRDEFQAAIKDLCLRRFTTKKIQQYGRITLQFASDAKAIIDVTSTFQDLVQQKVMDQTIADSTIASKMAELEPKLATAISGMSDKAVYDMLKQQDNESNVAWTNEDPSFDELEKLIDEQLVVSGKPAA